MAAAVVACLLAILLDCSLGQDVLAQFAEYVINFRSMSFVLVDQPAVLPEHGK